MWVTANALRRRSRLLTPVVLCVLAVGVGAVAASDPAQGGSIQFSLSPDRASPQALDGATVSGSIYAFIAARDGVKRVRFYFDDPETKRAFRRYEDNSPYDFSAGDVSTARPFDTSTVLDGGHTITAVLEFETGSTETLQARFTVLNHAPQAPVPPTGAQAPVPPTGLQVVSATEPSVTVSWSAAENAPAGYGLYRDGARVATTSAASYTFSSLTCGTSYTLAVDSYDDAGNRSAAVSLNATTAACPAGAPAPGVQLSPLRYSASSDRSESRTLESATASGSLYVFLPATTGIDGVAFYLDDPQMLSKPRQREANPPHDFAGGDASVARPFDTTRVADGRHTITALAYLMDGETAVASATFTVANSQAPDTPSPSPGIADEFPPTKPPLLAVTNASETSLSLSWGASSDNVGVAGYTVYQDGVSVQSSSARTATLAGLRCGTTYTIAVEAYDSALNRSPRATLITATRPCLPVATSGALLLSPTGSDSNPCSLLLPCKSLNRAYRVAKAGQTVLISEGTYGAQTVLADSSKTAPAVIFAPVAGARVTLGELDVYASHFELRDVRVDRRWYVYASASHVTMRNVKSERFYITSASNVAVLGGDYGPSLDGVSQIKSAYESNVAPRNILLDGVSIHDVNRPAGTDLHRECLHVMAVDGLTIRNSRFNRCLHFAISFNEHGDSNAMRGITVENSWFGLVDGYYAINLSAGDPCEVLIRFNTFSDKGISTSCPETGAGVRIESNILPKMTSTVCGSNSYSWNWNVYESGVRCGSSDLVAPISYVDRAGFDLRLVLGSAAVNRGNPSSYPSFDIFGGTRPLSGAPDAGAHERQ